MMQGCFLFLVGCFLLFFVSYSALYVESHPRLEDFHPISVRVGQFKKFWGSCKKFFCCFSFSFFFPF
jgi:hypothetical protein